MSKPIKKRVIWSGYVQLVPRFNKFAKSDFSGMLFQEKYVGIA